MSQGISTTELARKYHLQTKMVTFMLESSGVRPEVIGGGEKRDRLLWPIRPANKVLREFRQLAPAKKTAKRTAKKSAPAAKKSAKQVALSPKEAWPFPAPKSDRPRVRRVEVAPKVIEQLQQEVSELRTTVSSQQKFIDAIKSALGVTKK